METSTIHMEKAKALVAADEETVAEKRRLLALHSLPLQHWLWAGMAPHILVAATHIATQGTVAAPGAESRGARELLRTIVAARLEGIASSGGGNGSADADQPLAMLGPDADVSTAQRVRKIEQHREQCRRIWQHLMRTLGDST